MQSGTDPRLAERIAAVVALVKARIADPIESARVLRFVREYFVGADPDDLAERQSADLYGAALSHYRLAAQRAPGTAKVRVFNPRAEEHGWQSRHTVVAIANDDMPFLVDSTTMEIARHGLTLHFIVHPIFSVNRARDGRLTDIAPRAEPLPGGRPESFILMEVDRIAGAAGLEALARDLARVLADVRTVVADWQAMRAKVGEALAEAERRAPPLPAEDLAEGRAFLAWLADNHFTFLGYRCHDLVVRDGEDALRVVPGSGLGILRETEAERLSASFALLPPEVRAAARRREFLVVTQANSRSTVHRPGFLDYVGVKRFDDRGEVVGEHRFLGLYTSSAYNDRPAEIPLLRRKVAAVTERAGLAPGSHAAKALAHILDTYPRDELFQIGEDDLFRIATGILALGERPRFRLFVRRDPFERFVACLAYAPREHYNTELRQRWQAILTEAFDGVSSDFSVLFSESVLARILITVRTRPGAIPAVDVRELERRLAAAGRRWEDDLRDALVERLGEARGHELFAAYRAAFPAAYREDVPARAAVADIEAMAALAGEGAIALNLYRPPEADHRVLRFKLLRSGGAVPLSDSLPMLERMGLKVVEERPYRIVPAQGAAVWIHDFGLEVGGEEAVDADAVGELFEEAFAAVFRGEIESDDFNRLVLAARLPARDITVLRAYARYLRQTAFPLSQSFVEATLAAHPALARRLVELFRLRFDPARADGAWEAEAGAIAAALDAVENLSEDRVLRQLLALVLATTRTNFFRSGAEGTPRSFLSFKLDPARIPGLPEPRPMFEIFVYSPRFEGVHLRGGKVARGGLRWSDRPEDFRTEVLGLVKAQMVKNAIIVPVGSKGGFVVKRGNPADREAWLAEGVACYRDYLRGLLDLTDNLVAGKVVPPRDVRRHDGDDPYLVVAADKGTATFSDHANAVAREYGFWLDDAFASGGSAGYDHKAMGITARGAWESVKRHFREMGVDVQTTDFTVAGIGDMSGDVFGNGMLLSRHIRLVAAFDHRHVFIDPDPDAAASFAERERLFRLPRSSWADYDPALISRGGGVWPRSAKSIPLSPEAQRALGVAAASLTPAELVSAILRAPVDLLYNGGIGTYVKASAESHAEVGDRANDAVRVNGRELRCRAVAEGGNLGFTQRGRIEYAREGRGGEGGRIYTDAIDNSAGVDTSDHEVNIKILLGLAVADGELTVRQRDALLAQMADEVARLVLRDNYFQTQSLSIAGRLERELLESQARFIRFLERAGRLKRALEFLPDEEEIAARAARGIGLSAPENAVLLAYSKMWLYDELLASPLPDEPWVAAALARYFPEALRGRFAGYMPRHPLRREIVATHVVNSMVNRVGATFVHRLADSTGAAPADVVRAYLLAREVFGAVSAWAQIEALDNRVADEVQARMVIRLGRLLVRATTWFLRWRGLAGDMAATIARLAPAAEALARSLPGLLDADAREEVARVAEGLTAAGVPAALAERVALAEPVFAALDIAEVAAETGRSREAVARVHFALAERFGFAWLRGRIGQLPGTGHWQALAKSALRDELAALARSLTAAVGAAARDDDAPEALIARWAARNEAALARADRLLAELRAAPAADLAMLSVAIAELRGLLSA
ncbi:MAG: NAD-glutamate dehydrogenase [Burkholderiales bacterium]|nr:NAD-glutamate dehydrogenase [Burkholderiales bacterium]